ncbi:pentapeptide repeat-containing protein [Nostoc sp.]|uniref:pentapeptide repeat-containing protein n=1 Tax=Nostoc sp. TaxID=1180 RepID=UPI003FA58824
MRKYADLRNANLQSANLENANIRPLAKVPNTPSPASYPITQKSSKTSLCPIFNPSP